MKPYYDDGRGIVIYHGDCREILPTLNVCTLLLTDPPYGVDLGNHAAAKEKRPQFLAKKGYESYEDTYENFKAIVVPSVVRALGVTHRGIVFTAGTRMWDYPTPAAVGGVYLPAACGRCAWGFSSLAHVLFYGKAPGLEQGAKHIAIRSTEAAGEWGHPCPKPLSWISWLVDLGSVPGDTILDPFMGSGTTLRAAKDLGRKAIGIEIEEKYCEIAVRRLAQEVLL